MVEKKIEQGRFGLVWFGLVPPKPGTWQVAPPGRHRGGGESQPIPQPQSEGPTAVEWQEPTPRSSKGKEGGSELPGWATKRLHSAP